MMMRDDFPPLSQWSGKNSASVFPSPHPQRDEGGPGEEGEAGG